MDLPLLSAREYYRTSYQLEVKQHSSGSIIILIIRFCNWSFSDNIIAEFRVMNLLSITTRGDSWHCAVKVKIETLSMDTRKS